MARIVRRPRVMHFAVSSPTLSEEQIAKILESVTGGTVAAAPPTKTAKPVKATGRTLYTRNVRHKGVFPCRRVPSTLHAAAIIWPMGVPHTGCGRTFGSEKRRDAHERGDGWNLVSFPNGCLDRILPAELRETR